MRPNESGTTRVSMSRTIASLNDLRIFVTRSSADSITFDTIRKRSKPCFIPFFKMDVELFMRTYIAIEFLVGSKARRNLNVSRSFGYDALGYFTARLDPTPTRVALAAVLHRANRN